MSIELLTLLILVSLMILLFSGIPITFTLLTASMVPFLLIRGPDSLATMACMTFRHLTTSHYLALPTFIFMAAVLEFSGLGSAMYDLMYRWFAGLRGGLAMGTIAISTVMAAMSGTAATATLTMGMLAYPEMERRGYDKTLMVGTIPAGGILGPLIPPSVGMIVVASVSQQSIGKLFIAGVFPGLVASFGFMAYIGIRCWLNPAMGPSIPPEERVGWREKLKSTRLAGLPFILIIFVLGMIYSGLATPSEAGAVGALGALVCALIYRNLNLPNLVKATSRTLKVAAMLLWLLMCGKFFSQMLGVMGVQAFVQDFILGLEIYPWAILAGMLGSLFVLGCFMDDSPLTVIFLPIYLPIVSALGFPVFWFVFIWFMNCLIAIMTPPFGMVLFYFKGLNIPGVTMMDIYRGIIPFVIIMIVVMILCIVFPPLAMWLPSTMIG